MKTNVLVKGWVLWLFFISQLLYPPLLKLPMIRKHNEIALASPLSHKLSPHPQQASSPSASEMPLAVRSAAVLSSLGYYSEITETNVKR